MSGCICKHPVTCSPFVVTHEWSVIPVSY